MNLYCEMSTSQLVFSRGCLYKENCPRFIPAKRGPRFSEIPSYTQIPSKIKERLYEKKLSRPNGISAEKRRDPGLPGQYFPI